MQPYNVLINLKLSVAFVEKTLEFYPGAPSRVDLIANEIHLGHESFLFLKDSEVAFQRCS